MSKFTLSDQKYEMCDLLIGLLGEAADSFIPRIDNSKTIEDLHGLSTIIIRELFASGRAEYGNKFTALMKKLKK